MKRTIIAVLSIIMTILWSGTGISIAENNSLSISQTPLSATSAELLARLTCPAEQLRQSTPRLNEPGSSGGEERMQVAQESVCPDGYPVNCNTDYCCESGYTCETECECKVGKARCSSGCCPFATPHTCPESSQCFETANDAVQGGCTWDSVEVCGVAR